MPLRVRVRAVQVAWAIALLLSGLALLALYVLAIWRAPEFLVNQDVLTQANPEHRLPAEHNSRLIVVSIGGALVVLAGLVYTARNYRLAQRGQVTDRFTKALERLGSDEMYVRIGGVHALEHVMRDSPVHHGDVVEVLVAFIRDRAPRVAKDEPADGRWMHPPIGTEPPEMPDEPAADVQAALTALGQRPQRRRHERSRVNFSGLHLQSANLYQAGLRSANLRGARLDGANLRGARLYYALLEGAQLNRAILEDARLDGAILKDVRFDSARLRGARLNGAYLWNARLDGANLKDARLDNAHLEGARLDGANLMGARLKKAKITQAQLDPTMADRHTDLPKGLSHWAID